MSIPRGVLAQLVERQNGILQADGSIPSGSTFWGRRITAITSALQAENPGSIPGASIGETRASHGRVDAHT